jgi:hypothetical protein
MSTSQEEHGDKTVSPELDIQNRPQRTVSAETAAHSTECKRSNRFLSTSV